MSKKKSNKNNEHRLCFNCDECIYIGDGDSICGITSELVIEDFCLMVRSQCPKNRRIKEIEEK